MKKNTEILKCIFNSLKTMVFDAISFNSKFTPKTSAYSKFTPKTSAFTFLVIDISFINHGLSWKALDIWLKTDIEWVILLYFRTYFASVYKIEGKGPFVFIYLFIFNFKNIICHHIYLHSEFEEQDVCALTHVTCGRDGIPPAIVLVISKQGNYCLWLGCFGDFITF